MTLRCNGLISRINNRVSKWNATGISLLLILSAIGSTSVNAQQNNEADVPPPPQIRQGAGEGPDPEFRSPMRRNVQELGEDGGDFSRRRMRRQQMMQQQMEGGDPTFGGPGGPGGPGMGFGPGMRRGMRGGMGPDGMGGPGGFGGRRQGGATMGGGFGRKLDLTPLNLSEEQKSRIKQIRQGTRERAKDVRRALMGKQMTLRNMIFSPDATDAQIRATRKEVRKMQDEMEELNLEDLLAIRGLLTAEQKQKLPQIAPGQRGPRTANADGPGGGKKRLSQNQRSAQK